jgi:hypothetical protein
MNGKILRPSVVSTPIAHVVEVKVEPDAKVEIESEDITGVQRIAPNKQTKFTKFTKYNLKV